MIYIARSCPLHGCVSHPVVPLVFFGPPSSHPMSMPNVSLNLNISIQVASADNSYTGTISDNSIVLDPPSTSQQPVVPTFSDAYVTCTGSCVHQSRCKHLRGFHKALKLCSCIKHPNCSLQVFADVNDLVHIHACDLKASTKRCLTWCKDCW